MISRPFGLGVKFDQVPDPRSCPLLRTRSEIRAKKGNKSSHHDKHKIKRGFTAGIVPVVQGFCDFSCIASKDTEATYALLFDLIRKLIHRPQPRYVTNAHVVVFISSSSASLSLSLPSFFRTDKKSITPPRYNPSHPMHEPSAIWECLRRFFFFFPLFSFSCLMGSRSLFSFW